MKEERRRKEGTLRKKSTSRLRVKKDVTGWTVVTRNKRQRKMVQIFVKVDESKVTLMEVSLTDGKVGDVTRQIQKDEDVYVTMNGKVLRRNEKLKSCGVTDGCTIQVTSRMRGGGREKKQTTKPEGPEQKCDEESKGDEGPAMMHMDEAMRRLEENEEYQKIIECVSEGSEGEVQQKVQNYLAHIQKVSWMNKEQYEHLESEVWRAFEARRKGRGEEQEQRRQTEQGQNTGQEQSKQGKHLRFGKEDQLKETTAESTDEPEVTGRTCRPPSGGRDQQEG